MTQTTQSGQSDGQSDGQFDALAQGVSWAGSLARAAVRAKLFDITEGAPVFGRYRWVRPLGKGGMGTVVVAKDPLLDREVAVKLVEAGDPRLRARVIREAQANARVTHPNVVAVYDVGAADRRVYIVTELVLGDNLLDWSASAPRPWRTVLDVYLAAGEGLAAVHAAGLIHRDFKPANCVIGPDGRARLIDFGIARARSAGGSIADDADKSRSDGKGESRRRLRRREGGSGPLALKDNSESIITAGKHAGTPAYMAPEQFTDEPVDARADQFSFCVALWEALTGERPGGRAAIFGVSEGPWPPRAPEASEVPREVFRVLSRGLAADPAARFVSVGSLLAALRGAARRRWRRAAFAAAVAVAGLIAIVSSGEAAAGASCHDVGEPGRLLWSGDAKRDVAEHLAGLGSELATEAWPRIDAALGEYAASWQRERERSCTEDGAHSDSPQARCFAWGLANAQRLVGDLARVDGEDLVRELDRALQLPAPSRCVDPTALAVEPPVPPPEIAVAVDGVRARLVEIDASMRRGDFATALAQSESSLPIAEAIGFAPLEAEIVLARARARAELGPFPLALDELREAYTLAEEIGYAAVATHAAAAAGSLLAVRLQDAEQASTWSKLALAAARATEDAALVVAAETTAATVEVALGHHNEARELYEGLLARIGRTCAHPCTQAVDLEIPLANVYDALGNRAEATAHAHRSVEIALAAYGTVHPTTAAAYNQLCIAFDSDNDFAAARPQCAKAYDVARRIWGEEHPETAATLGGLASVDASIGDNGSAREKMVAAHGVLSRTLGDAHVHTLSVLSNLALLDRSAGDYVRAEAAFRSAILAVEATDSPDPLVRATLHANLGTTLIDLERDAEAVAHFETTLALRTASEVGAADMSLTRTQLGGALLRLGRIDDAREMLDAALASEPTADSPYNLALRRYYLARTLKQRDSARAARLLTEAVRQLQGQGEDALLAECREVLAGLDGEPSEIKPRRARTGSP